MTAPNYAGHTPLHLACLSGSAAIVEALLAVPDVRDAVGQKNYSEETALHSACYKGQAECAKLLTENGAPLEEEGVSEG